MNLVNLCLAEAALFGVGGMLLGLFMGIGGDFGLGHAHSHINLAGWATLAIFGLYHRGAEREHSKLTRAQVALAMIGTPVFTVFLTAYLASGTQTKSFIVVALLGAIVLAASMMLFLAVVLRDVGATGHRAARPRDPTE
jgi:O-antigen/teichoic acid export membrane protein